MEGFICLLIGPPDAVPPCSVYVCVSPNPLKQHGTNAQAKRRHHRSRASRGHNRARGALVCVIVRNVRNQIAPIVRLVGGGHKTVVCPQASWRYFILYAVWSVA